MGPRAAEVDCDYDGLSNSDEASLGTDSCDNDTDGDGLGDLDELQASTDPLLADSDGDGLEDYLELYFGFNPTNPDTLNDGILDGDRWVVHACDSPASEPVDYYLSSKGDWRLGLPPAFSNHSELAIATALPTDKLAASVFDDPANEVAGALLSNAPVASQQSPVDVLLALRSRVASVGTIQQDNTSGEFDTHDFNKAAVSKFLIRTSTARTARAVRDSLLFGIAPFSSADVTGLPNAAGNNYQDFRVFLSVTYRRDAVNGNRILIALAIAPSTKFDTRDKVRFRMDDLTNTTNVSQAGDGERVRCTTFRAGEGNPEADFYWVLDQSGSMYDDYTRVKAVANQFYLSLQNTSLDYRLAVANMDIAYAGRPRANAGWFTDLPTFIAEIVNIETGNYDCCDEFGLESAKQGITWMRSSSAPQALRIRPNAQLIMIFMSDEEAQTIQNNSLTSATGQQKMADFKVFFAANSIAFSIVNNEGEAYRQVALATGGSFADLDAADISETIEDIIYAATGLASAYVLPETPISSSLRVYKNSEWVPRSRENGFDYFANTNSIAFFGTYRPVPADPTVGRYGDDIAVNYQTFLDRTKNP